MDHVKSLLIHRFFSKVPSEEGQNSLWEPIQQVLPRIQTVEAFGEHFTEGYLKVLLQQIHSNETLFIVDSKGTLSFQQSNLFSILEIPSLNSSSNDGLARFSDICSDMYFVVPLQIDPKTPTMAEAIVGDQTKKNLYWYLKVMPWQEAHTGEKKALLIWESLSHWQDWMATVERQNQEAQAGLNAKSMFLTNMSHEIRTPMNAIIGMTYLLSKTPLSIDQAEYVEKLDGSAKTLLRIINDILDLSKIDAGKMVIEQRDFSLQSLIEEVLNLVRVPAEEKGLRIFCDFDDKVPKFLRGDDLRLKQVLTNLTHNAMKFTEEGFVALKIRCVESLKIEGVRLIFEIEDSGIGMGPNDLKKIFSPFVQVDSQSSRRYQGTGLGLNISQRLISLMGGTLSAESSLGVGTKMSFQLDLGTTSLTPLIEAPLSLPGNKHLWFIEPTSRVIENLQNVFKSLNIPCAWFKNVTEFSSQLAQASAAMNPRGDHFLIIDRGLWAQDSVRHFLINCKQSFQDTHRRIQIVVLTNFSHSQVESAMEGSMAVDFWMTRPLYPWVWKRLISDLVYGQLFHRKEPRKRAQSESRVRLEGRHVLLAEDNEVNQMVARNILMKVGAKVTVAKSGEEALKIWERNKGSFDAVLMDLQMPVMDGFEAVEKIRALGTGTQVPIIALTANVAPEERALCLEKGMNDYLTKPIEPDLLIRSLARWCNPQFENTSDTEDSAKGVIETVESGGVDWELALQNVAHKQTLLFEMAEKFINDYGGSAQLIRHFLSEGNMVQAQRLILSVKAVSGYLGAQELRKVSENLEVAIRQNQSDSINEDWVQFENQLRRVLLDIQEYLKVNGVQSLR